MSKMKTLLIATALSASALSAAAADLAKTNTVALEIGTFSIPTARSGASIAKFLETRGFVQGKNGAGRVVFDGAERATDALAIFKGLAAPIEVSNAVMYTRSGVAVPYSVGENRDYVRQVNFTTDRDGKQHVVRHIGEANSGISVNLLPKVQKNGVVELGIKSDLTRIQLRDQWIGGERLQLLNRQIYQLSSNVRLRGDQTAVFARYVPAEKPTLFSAGEILVTVAKAKTTR
jgi:hypothetical protein